MQIKKQVDTNGFTEITTAQDKKIIIPIQPIVSKKIEPELVDVETMTDFEFRKMVLVRLGIPCK